MPPGGSSELASCHGQGATVRGNDEGQDNAEERVTDATRQEDCDEVDVYYKLLEYASRLTELMPVCTITYDSGMCTHVAQ